MSDEIILKGIRSNCIIGINLDEREIKQEVIINLIIFHDFSNLNDEIDNTINYSSIYIERNHQSRKFMTYKYLHS